MSTQYLKLVEKTLIERWNTALLLDINNEDLKAGMILLTKIAVQAVSNKSTSVKESESIGIADTHKISLEKPTSSQTIDKIEEFVQDKADIFITACKTGFPFSSIEKTSAEIALKHTLETYNNSILFQFVAKNSRWMSEKKLKERLNFLFKHLQVSEIAKACFCFKQAYIENEDNTAGYYLLLLIKLATGCSYEIPEKGTFNNKTVTKVLSEFIANSGHLTNALNFIEILHSSFFSQKFLYKNLLDPKSSSLFLTFATEILKDIPMDKWPSKSSVIINLFDGITPDSRLYFSVALASSKDAITSKIGNHLLAALKAASLRKALPHYYALKKLLPEFNETHILYIFGHHYVEFSSNRIYNNLPEFAKRLNFNDMKNVFIHNSLMIGIHDPKFFFRNQRMPTYLFAYDMYSEKMVWGIPLSPNFIKSPSLNTSTSSTFGISIKHSPRFALTRIGAHHLSILFIGMNKLHFIDLKTGELDYTLELPEKYNGRDNIHIIPEGIAYQTTSTEQKEILIGSIINKKLHHSFKSKRPGGKFTPLSTHCGFQHYKDKLVLFGPTGNQVTIHDCMNAKAQDEKLYTIERDPAHKDKCLLKIRTLKVNNEVVSDVEKSISLNIERAKLINFCQNNMLILFSNNSPVFVNLNNSKVTYFQNIFPFDATIKTVVNTESGELWTWDSSSKKILKISSDNITLMGTLESRSGRILLHADNEDRLYFADID